jgi:hypothetical protein
MNRLYFGDNLKWLRDRREFPDASIDPVISIRRLIRMLTIASSDSSC